MQVFRGLIWPSLCTALTQCFIHRGPQLPAGYSLCCEACNPTHISSGVSCAQNGVYSDSLSHNCAQ